MFVFINPFIKGWGRLILVLLHCSYSRYCHINNTAFKQNRIHVEYTVQLSMHPSLMWQIQLLINVTCLMGKSYNEAINQLLEMPNIHQKGGGKKLYLLRGFIKLLFKLTSSSRHILRIHNLFIYFYYYMTAWDTITSCWTCYLHVTFINWLIKSPNILICL